MDWTVHRPADTCALTGEPFQPGDRLRSFLLRGPGGELSRCDVAAARAGDFQPPEGTRVLGWWNQTVRAEAETEAEQKKRALASSEELFLSLYEGEEPGAQEERALLQHLLGLQLERKRLLKPAAEAASRKGVRALRHVPSGRIVEVPSVEVTPEKLLKVEASLHALTA